MCESRPAADTAKEHTLLTAEQVADYFLVRTRLESVNSDENMTNLKLQKLCYYAQGICLALFDRPMFKDRIEAWTHGPVVPDLWKKYRGYGSGAIDVSVELDMDSYSEEDRELLEEVYDYYGQFSAWKLRDMTHAESPWQDASPSGIISHAVLKDFFADRVING